MYAVFEFRLSRRNTAEVNIGVFRRSCRAAQRRSLKDRRSARFPGEATGDDDQRRRPPAGSSRTARREAFIVISRANSSNISAFGPERRVLIFSLGWLSVFVYERPLYLFLSISSFRTSFVPPFSPYSFSHCQCSSLCLLSPSCSLFRRTPSTRGPLVELLSLPFSFSRTPASATIPPPPPTLFRRNSLLLSSSSLPRGLPNFTIFPCLPPLILQSLFV